MKRILTAAIIAMISSAASAQSINKKLDDSYAPSVAASGVRLSVFTSALKGQFKVSGSGYSSETEKESIDNTVGVSLGYAHLPIQAAGFTVGASYMNIHEGTSDSGQARLDGNLAVAINQLFHIKGGANISKIVKSEAANEWDPGLGFQVGAGLQFSRTFGMDLGYTIMNQSSTINGYKITAQLTGLELGVHATF